MRADGDAGESRRQCRIHGPVAAVRHWHSRYRDIWSFARDTSRNVIRHLTRGERTLELVRGHDEVHDGMLLSRWPLRYSSATVPESAVIRDHSHQRRSPKALRALAP